MAKTSPFRRFKKSKKTNFVALAVLIVGLVAGVIGLQSPKLLSPKAEELNCKTVGDKKYQVNAISKVISIDNQKMEFKWKPDEKSTPITILGWCPNVPYVRRGYGGEEEGDTPMNFGDLKAGHRVEIIGFGYEAAPSTQVVPSLIRDTSLYKIAVIGKVNKITISQVGPTKQTGFVMTDVIRKNSGNAVGNDVTVVYSDKVGCRQYGETDYTEANCKGIKVGHRVEVNGVYDTTKKSFIDPDAPLPTDGSRFWTQIYDPSLKPDSNVKDWSTQEVSLIASNFFMVIDGKTYVGDGQITKTSDTIDPNNPDITNLLVSWKEKGNNMKVRFAFKKSATEWWVSGLRTYKDGQWTDYQIAWDRGPSQEFLIKAVKDVEFTASTLDIVSFNNEKSKGKIHFDGLRLKAFTSPPVIPPAAH